MQLRCQKSFGCRERSRAAFTLVEVMIASMIGAVLFLALFYGISQANNLVQKEREALRATQILVGKVEGLRLCAWDTVTTNITYQLFNTAYVPANFTNYYYPVGLGGTNFNGNSVAYIGTIQIITNNLTFYGSTLGTNGLPAAGTAPSYSNNMDQAFVSVTWSDIHGGRTNTYTRSMRTYIAQYGVQNYTTVTN